MPPATDSNAPDQFQSRLAAALESVRPEPRSGESDAPETGEGPVASATPEAPDAPAPLLAEEDVTEPGADEPFDPPPPPAETPETPSSPPAAGGSEPVIESDDSFFDDPPPSDETPEEPPQASEPPEMAEPAGSGEYEVQVGDCIASIAAAHGLYWETLWNDGGNADLRAAREDPNVLLPGDRVHIPEKRRKEEPGQTETRHRFKKRGEPCELLVTLLDEDDQPRAGAAYRLYLEGAAHSGALDANGTLAVRMPANTRSARLIIEGEPFEEVYNLQLGALDPDDAVSGVQARLRNLGYLAENDGEIPPFELARFQSRNGLAETGELDDATRERLRDKHYSVGG